MAKMTDQNDFYLDRDQNKTIHSYTLILSAVLFAVYMYLINKVIPIFDFSDRILNPDLSPAHFTDNLLSDIRMVIAIFLCILLTYRSLKIIKKLIRRKQNFRMKFYHK